MRSGTSRSGTEVEQHFEKKSLRDAAKGYFGEGQVVSAFIFCWRGVLYNPGSDRGQLNAWLARAQYRTQTESA